MIKTIPYLVLCSFILCLSVGRSTALGAPSIVEEYSESKGFLPLSMTGLNPLDKIFYLSGDIAMSFNYIESTKEVKSGHIYPSIGIKHSLKNTWFLGFNIGNFNYYKPSESNAYFNYLKFSQEISYPFNLYYPLYTLLGVQMGYAFSVASQVKLFKIDRSRKNTLFFSGFITFLYYYSPDYSFYLRVDFNHSVSTSDMNQMSVGLGIMKSII